MQREADGGGGIPGEGDRIPRKQKDPQPVSSSEESGQGISLRQSHSPSSITSDQQHEYEIDLARCSSPAIGDKSPDLLSQSSHGWTA